MRVLIWCGLLALVLTACGGQNSHDRHGGHAGHKHGDGSEKAAQSSITVEFQAGGAGALQAGREVPVTMQVKDAQGAPVTRFELSHEKLMHLIVVSQDLQHFEHVHPEHKGGGKFEIGATFPAGGAYKLFADFVPEGQAEVTRSHWLKVSGETIPNVPVRPDGLVKQVDGKEITLSASGLKAGKEAKLEFHIVDAVSRKKIDDLQPYLGAMGHVVILSDDAEQYLHVHPTGDKLKTPTFATVFPKSGTYKMWGQFQHRNRIMTVPFVVKVE